MQLAESSRILARALDCLELNVRKLNRKVMAYFLHAHESLAHFALRKLRFGLGQQLFQMLYANFIQRMRAQEAANETRLPAFLFVVRGKPLPKVDCGLRIISRSCHVHHSYFVRFHFLFAVVWQLASDFASDAPCQHGSIDISWIF